MRVVCLLVSIFFTLAFGAAVAAPDDTPRAISGQVAVVLDENTEFVANFIITDDDGNPFTTTLEGDDAELFQIVAGELSFIAAPNFEFPLDQGADNTYEVRVNGRDVSSNPYAVDISATVINVNEAPVVQNDLQYQRSEGEGFTIVLRAEDDEGDEFSYALTGDDADLFEINEGVLTPVNAFDFEQPTDSDSNNIYDFIVVTTDEFSATAEHNFELTITNIEEQASFTNFVRTEFEEAQVSGHSSPLFSSLSVTDPDDEFGQHVLTVTGLLEEDTFIIDASVDAQLEFDTDSGQFTYNDNLVATLSEQIVVDVKTYQLEFSAASNNESVNAVLDSIRYQSSASVPTPSRDWVIHLKSDEGLVTSLWQESGYELTTNPSWLPVVASSQFSLFDVDQDEQLDLFWIDELGQVDTYLNTSSTAPSFDNTAQSSGFFVGKNLGTGANLAFYDFNNDEIIDVLVANEQGFISYFTGQISGAEQTFVLQSGENNPMNLVDVGDFAAISVADIDGDLDGDLFVGNQLGEFLYYENTGNSSQPYFTLQSTNPIPVSLAGTNLVSVIADLDNDTDVDVILGNGEGQVTLYRNDGTPTAPDFVEVDDDLNPFFSEDFTAISNLEVADVNQDSLKDVLISDQNNHYLMSLSASFSVDITRRDNQPPQLISEASLDMVGSVEIPFPYALFDEEGDEVTVTWSTSPDSGLSIVSDDGSALSLLADIVTQESSFVLSALLDDGRDQTTVEIPVTVYPLGAEVAGYNVPQIGLPTSVSIVEGETVDITAQITDLDGDELSLFWLQISGPVASLSANDTANITFVAPEVTGTSVIRLQLAVSDGLFDVVANINITVQDESEAVEDEDDDSFLGLAIQPGFVLLIALLLVFRKRSRKTV